MEAIALTPLAADLNVGLFQMSRWGRPIVQGGCGLLERDDTGWARPHGSIGIYLQEAWCGCGKTWFEILKIWNKIIKSKLRSSYNNLYGITLV